MAGIGAFFTGFAWLTDFGAGALQFVALEAVRAFPADQALAIITALSNSQNLQTFVYLPYLGFLLGLGLLAWSLDRHSGERISALWLALTSLLFVVGAWRAAASYSLWLSWAVFRL